MKIKDVIRWKLRRRRNIKQLKWMRKASLRNY